MGNKEITLEMSEISTRCKIEAETLYLITEELEKLTETLYEITFKKQKDALNLEFKLNTAGRKIISKIIEKSIKDIENINNRLTFVTDILKNKITKEEKEK
jgi:hypothetical protein